MVARSTLVASLAAMLACAAPVPAAAPTPPARGAPATDAALDALRLDARALESLAQTPLARAFLHATASQAPVSPRVVWTDPATHAAWSDADAARLPPGRRGTLAVNPSRHFDLGVDDATFLSALHDALVPGGLALLYNVCPAPAPDGAPYIPWADGRSPFDRHAWEDAGFELRELDRDDTPALRAVAHVLRWDSGEDALDIEHDVFATYTLARRR